jgi:hypothetical protein
MECMVYFLGSKFRPTNNKKRIRANWAIACKATKDATGNTFMSLNQNNRKGGVGEEGGEKKEIDRKRWIEKRGRERGKRGSKGVKE